MSTKAGEQSSVAKVHASNTGEVHGVQPSLPHMTEAKPLVRNKIQGVRLTEKEPAATQWNTKYLGRRFMVDAACAATAGGMVAPLVVMIDKAIIENASGRRAMLPSIKSSFRTLLLRPHRYFTARPFLLIFGLYSSTYIAANVVDTFKSTTNNKPASAVTSGPAKFLTTTSANLGLSLYKDSQFTKMFGVASSSRAIPPVTLALFTIRDCCTIFASFNLPLIVAPHLPLTAAMEKYVNRASAAQFLCPAGIQLISTNFHLLGLDYYNRKFGPVPFRNRLIKVWQDFPASAAARMCRIVPAFGFGGVVNNGMRAKLMKGLE